MVNFVEEYSGINVPLYGSSIARAFEEPYEPPRFTDITARCNNAGMKIKSECRVIEMRITDMRTGWGQAGDELKTSSSTAWAPRRNRLLLPPLVKQTTLGAATNNGAMFYCYITVGPGFADGTNPVLPSALVMGGGSTVGGQLFTETTSLNPVPLEWTWLGAGNVVSISATTGRQSHSSIKLIVGYNGGVAADGSNAGGSQGSGIDTVTALHANTANCYGVVETNINSATPGAGTFVFYAGTSIYTLSTTSAITAAPTQVMQDIPAGGSILGIDALQKNWLNRIWMVWPKQTQSNTAFSSALDPKPALDVVSLNLEGTGPELLPSILDRIIGAILWNKQVVRWDGLRVTVHDGEIETDLMVLEGREQNSDFRWAISNVTTDGTYLYVWIVRMDMTVAVDTLGVSVLSCEKYLGTPGKFTNVSQAISAANSNAGSVDGTDTRENIYGSVDYMHQVSMGIPISKQTGFCHLNMMNSTKWDRFWFPPPGVDPFLHFVKTGSSNEISQEWAPSAVLTSSKFPIGNYHNLPIVCAGVSAAEMDIAAGGSTAKVKVEWATQDGTSHTFTGAKNREFDGATPYDKLYDWWLDNSTAFTQGQFRLTLTQGSDANKTMDALPIIFYFIVNLDGKVRTPQDAGFVGWFNE